MIYCFGDSWAYGSELDFDAGEKPFVELFGVPFENLGMGGIGYGLVTSISVSYTHLTLPTTPYV